MAVAFFFVLSLSEGDNQRSKTGLKSGQAKKAVFHSGNVASDHKITTGSETSSRGQDFDKDAEDSMDAVDSLDEDKEMDTATDKFERAMQLEISINESMLSEEMNKAMEPIKEGLKDLLDASGVEFQADEIEVLKKNISDKLESDVDTLFKETSMDLLEDKKLEFEGDLDLDAEDGKTEGKIEADDQTSGIVLKLREGIDTIAIETKDQIKAMAAVAEKNELDAAFQAKTSSTYSAKISEDQVISIEAKVSSKKKTKTPKKSTKKEAALSDKHSKKSSVKASTPESPTTGDNDTPVDVELSESDAGDGVV
jgi:hypothetical protein